MNKIIVTSEILLFGICSLFRAKRLPGIGYFNEVIVQCKQEGKFPDLLSYIDTRQHWYAPGDIISETFFELVTKGLFRYTEDWDKIGYEIISGPFFEVYDRQLAVPLYDYTSQLRELANLIAAKDKERTE